MQEEIEDNHETVKSLEERSRRAETLLQDSLADLSKERTINLQNDKSRNSTDKIVKDLNAKIFDLESSLLLKDSNNNRRLEGRIEELTQALDKESMAKSELIKTVRKHERTLRELQFSISDKEKAKQKSEEEVEKLDSKLKKMKNALEELVNLFT